MTTYSDMSQVITLELKQMRNFIKLYDDETKWFRFGKMRVQLERIWANGRCNCIVVHAVVIDDRQYRRNGVFTCFMDWIEQAAKEEKLAELWVTNVLDEWLVIKLHNRGFTGKYANGVAYTMTKLLTEN